jgi:hypothetical protein
VNNYRWFNPHLPQTLQIAVILLYINAFFLLLGIGQLGIFFLIMVGFVAGAFGIANEKKWGYVIGLIASAIQVLIWLFWVGLTDIMGNFSLLISFMFDVALFALLAHPMSRDYQRIWFR